MFFIRPASRADAGRRACGVTQGVHVADSRRKVLIADDEPNIVTALDFLLRRSGYDVRVASTGEEALALVESYGPDVVLLDIMMPQKSGYDVCQRMRERPEWRHIKIVMLSARGREAEVNKGLSLGADLYITKPFSTHELIATINGFFDGSAKPDTA
jgi:DNA-binding response OmpR family regulator